MNASVKDSRMSSSSSEGSCHIIQAAVEVHLPLNGNEEPVFADNITTNNQNLEDHFKSETASIGSGIPKMSSDLPTISLNPGLVNFATAKFSNETDDHSNEESDAYSCRSLQSNKTFPRLRRTSRHLTPGYALSGRSSVSSRLSDDYTDTASSIDNRSVLGAEREQIFSERLRSIVDHFRTRACNVKHRLEQPPSPDEISLELVSRYTINEYSSCTY